MFLASVVASAGLRMASFGIAILRQGVVHLGLFDDREVPPDDALHFVAQRSADPTAGAESAARTQTGWRP